MTAFILHFIAAVMWLAALAVAAAAGNIGAKSEREGENFGICLALSLAAIAYTLQVIA